MTIPLRQRIYNAVRGWCDYPLTSREVCFLVNGGGQHGKRVSSELCVLYKKGVLQRMQDGLILKTKRPKYRYYWHPSCDDLVVQDRSNARWKEVLRWIGESELELVSTAQIVGSFGDDYRFVVRELCAKGYLVKVVHGWYVRS